MTSFKCTISIFNITDEKTSFSITIPDQWNSKSAEKTITSLNKLLELRSQNGFKLHVEQVRKKLLILINDYSSSILGTFKNEVIEELKNSKHIDL